MLRLKSQSVALFVALLFYIVLIVNWWDFRVDDAYITLRYAKNAADGLGLVFNTGIQVEGFTNPLWTLMSIPIVRYVSSPLQVLKIIGALSGAAIIYLSWRLAFSNIIENADSLPDLRFSLISVMLFAFGTGLSLSLAIYAISGLETTLYTLFVIWGVFLFLIAETDKTFHKTTIALASMTFLLASLTRPEGVLIWLLTVLCLLIRVLTKSRFRINRSTLFPVNLMILTYIPLFAVFTFTRYLYFGELLPNTFGAKTHFGTTQLVSGINYMFGFLFRSGYWTLGLVAIVWLIISLSKMRKPIDISELADKWGGQHYLLLITGLLCLIPILEGGDWMPQWRFLVPVAPLFTIWSVRLVVYPPIWVRRSSTLLGAIFVVIIIASNFANIHSSHNHLVAYLNNLNRRECFASWLNANISDGYEIAYGDMGIVPYFNLNARFIDLNGLTDKFIATHLNSPLTVADYVLDLQPEVIIIATRINSQEVYVTPSYKAVAENHKFMEDYIYVNSGLSFLPGESMRPGGSTAGRKLDVFIQRDLELTWRIPSPPRDCMVLDTNA